MPLLLALGLGAGGSFVFWWLCHRHHVRWAHNFMHLPVRSPWFLPLAKRHVPVYMWNMAGYKPGAMPSGASNRHTFGGLSDAAFRLVPLLESGRDATWPWM